MGWGLKKRVRGNGKGLRRSGGRQDWRPIGIAGGDFAARRNGIPRMACPYRRCPMDRVGAGHDTDALAFRRGNG